MFSLPCLQQKVEMDRFFWDLAHSFCRQGKLSDALKCFCDTFFIRGQKEKDLDTSFEWMTFFDVQFTMYLLSKRKLDVEFPEGDMVYTLIRDTYKEIQKELENCPLGRPKNFYEWSKMVEIDFPYDFE